MKPMTKFRVLFILSALVIVPLSMRQAYGSIPTVAKGMWIWQLWNDENGNLNATISRLKACGVTWVAVKMADGNSFYNAPGASLYNWASQNGGLANVITTFHNNGIKVYGWQYVYGTKKWSNSATETQVSDELLDIPGIDGFIIDAEVEYEASGMTAVAAQYMDSLRANHPGSFIALTSFARVTGQPIPWTTFLQSCDANMPQAYWALRPTSVTSEFTAMRNDFESWEQTWISDGYLDAIKPIVPIGCENDGLSPHKYQMHSNDIQQFANLCQGAGYVGMSLWEYSIMDTMNWSDLGASWSNTFSVVPRVISSFPSSAGSVPAYDSIKISFNIPIDAASMKAAFTVNPAVKGSLIMNPDFTQWIFAPDTLLDPMTTYTISVDSSAASLLGVNLAENYTFTFTTAAIDTSAPSIVAISPRNGGFSVPRAYVEFIASEPIRLNTISARVALVDSTGGGVPFLSDISQITSDGHTLIAIRSRSNLIPGMRYTATLAPGLVDYYNVASRESYSTTFTVDSTSSGGSVIEGFESGIAGWGRPSASSKTFGVDTSSTLFVTAYRAYDGYSAGMLAYQFDSTNALCAEENSQGYAINGSTSFGMWIFGDNSRNELDFMFGPATQYVIPLDTVNWYGWNYVGMWRSSTDTTTNLFRGIAIKRLPNSVLDNGTIYVDDIQVNGRVTGTKTSAAQPISFQLSPNYPNPFNPSTTISYQLSAVGQVSLKVYDVLGRQVAVLVNEVEKPGRYEVRFDGSRLPSGVYFYTLGASDRTISRKMLLLK